LLPEGLHKVSALAGKVVRAEKVTKNKKAVRLEKIFFMRNLLLKTENLNYSSTVMEKYLLKEVLHKPALSPSALFRINSVEGVEHKKTNLFMVGLR